MNGNRPPPKHPSTGTGGPSNSTHHQASKKATGTTTSGGVDTLLTKHGRSIGTGEEVRFLLVKGPDRAIRADPVNPSAPKEAFPLVGKFSESVVRPDFHSVTWRTARLFQQDVPKAEDDSDEEVPSSSSTKQQQQPKKRWRARNQKEVGRQWILQEQVEFLESMMAKRQQQKQRTAGGGGGGNQPLDGTTNGNGTSSKYVGLPEHNPSQYILLETVGTVNGRNTTAAEDDDDLNSQNDPPTIQVTVLPTPFATISFSQPKATNTLSMSEAEQAIQDQRGKMTRFMMHDQKRIFQGQAPIHQSRTRLLGKLLPEGATDIDPVTGKIKKVSTAKRRRDGDEDDDDDDIMSDLAFRNRRGNGSRARKELLNSFGDAGMKVDADGVLGGTNDAIFGQRGQSFGRFQADQSAAGGDGTIRGGDGDDGGGDDLGGIGTGGAAESTKGNDGLAMADDFYQRDVQAEYEELDYDANEQFDDDDVDVGETEVIVDDTNVHEEDDDDDLEDDVDGARISGAEGLASLAGFKLMLAKAKGEITPEQAAELADKSKRQAEEMDKRQAESDRKKDDGSGDHLAKIMEAAEKARRDAEEKSAAAGGGVSAGAAAGGDGKARASSSLDDGPEYDENGARIINLQAVRREIWLNHGRITTKRLAKIFNVGRKSPQDRQLKLKEAIRELCTMETDPLGGNVLVLKQHYSNLKL